MESEKFWRSPKGSERYDRIWKEHVSRFRARARSTKLLKGSSFDVLALSDFPNPGLTFHMTSELSHYILDKGDGTGIRQELSMTTSSSDALEWVENVLLNLGQIMLEDRVALEAGILLEQYPLSTHIPKELTVSTMLSRVGLWLDEEDFLIESYFPTFIVELVPITDKEVRLIKENEDRFFMACESGEIDFMNLCR